MWESHSAFWRDFSKQLWESALYADFHRCGISIRPGIPPKLYPQILRKTLFSLYVGAGFSPRMPAKAGTHM